MPRNSFDFFQIFEELFDYFGALPVSMTLVKPALPMSFLTSVNDTGK
jgi:hypothetical protein